MWRISQEVAMAAVEYTHPGTPPKDDPQVERAMNVWDALTPEEQREIFRTLYRTTAAYEQTSDIDHLVRFAESVYGMVRLESSTNLREILRKRRQEE
jgi:hypothetical protein